MIVNAETASKTVAAVEAEEEDSVEVVGEEDMAIEATVVNNTTRRIINKMGMDMETNHHRLVVS